jgi:DNA-binding CsgD family transcriptional regulator
MDELLHRRQALAVVAEFMARLRAGLPAVLVIDGDRGSGKSALLRAALDGCSALVLRAHCHSAERGFTFGVVSQLFDRIPPDDLRSAPGPVMLAMSEPQSLERDLLDRFYRLTRRIAAASPVILAIDDVHLADPLSARWCSYVARRLDDLPVGLLITVKSRDLSCTAGGPAAGELMADLGALEYSRRIRTDPLCAPCAEELIARRLGEPVDPALARQCHAMACGNPQILGAMATRLAAAGLPADDDDATALAAAAGALADTALGWLRQDDPVKADLAEQFAVCAGGTLETTAMLAGQGEDVARATRAALRRVGLLDPRPPDRFAHPAIGEAIADQLSPDARTAMHVRAALMLSQIGEPATLTAEHVMSAGTIGEPWAREVLRQAAREAAAAGDWPRGARYLSRALLEPGQPRQLLTLTAELGTLEFHHDVGACLRRLATAADLAAGEPDAVAALAPFADATLAAEDSDAAAAFCRAVGALATSHAPDRAALLRLAAQAMLSGQALTPASASGVHQAIRRLHDGPDDIPARQLLSGMALGAAARGRNPRRTVALALRAVGGGPVRFMEPLPSTTACAALALAWAGDLSAASDACAQAIEASRRITSRTGEALALFVRSEIAYQRGSLNAALADAQQAIRLFQVVGATGLRAVAVAHSTRVLLMRGELGAVSTQAADVGHESSGHPFVLGIQQETRGMIAAAHANRALALRLYLECGRHLMAGGLVNPACSAWRSRAVAVLIGLGRKPEARALGEHEVALARAWGAAGPLGRALVGYAMAHDGAARLDLLGEAVSVLEDSDCRLNLARALIRLGTEMYAAGHSRSARDVLERGLDMSNECGAATLTAVAHRAMHAAGARPRGQSASVTLTAAERRVADLVISGMSNQAVATTLTLSKRTVDTHLGRIYRKLGITGRTRLREAIAGPDRS